MVATKEYVDLGISSLTGEWTAPRSVVDAKGFWRDSKFFYAGVKSGEGDVIRVVPRVDPISGKDGYTFHEAPSGAPVFGYREANEIRRRIFDYKHGGSTVLPIESFVEVCGVKGVSPDWLLTAGYKGELPTNSTVDVEEVAIGAQHDLVNRIQEAGGSLPLQLMNELGLTAPKAVEAPVVDKKPELDITDLS